VFLHKPTKRHISGSLVFPVETNKASKTNIDSKELTGSDFNQNANFHRKYQRAIFQGESGAEQNSAGI
jgi:hypothetical protein